MTGTAGKRQGHHLCSYTVSSVSYLMKCEWNASHYYSPHTIILVKCEWNSSKKKGTPHIIIPPTGKVFDPSNLKCLIDHLVYWFMLLDLPCLKEHKSYIQHFSPRINFTCLCYAITQHTIYM
jgi:hypothetical protein